MKSKDKVYNVQKISNLILFFLEEGITELSSEKFIHLCFLLDKHHIHEYTIPALPLIYIKEDEQISSPWLTSLLKQEILDELALFENNVKIIKKENVFYFEQKSIDKNPKFFSRSLNKMIPQLVKEFKYSTLEEIIVAACDLNSLQGLKNKSLIPYSLLTEKEHIKEYLDSFLNKISF